MSLRKAVKRHGRKAQKITAKIVKPVTAALATVASAIVPGSGVVFTAAGAGIARVTGATAARDKGLSGREARAKGRKLAKQTMKLGLIGTVAGTGLGLGAAALAGTSALGGVVKAAPALLSRSAPTPAPSPLEGGIQTESSLWDAIPAPAPAASAAPASSGSDLWGTVGDFARNALGSTREKIGERRDGERENDTGGAPPSLLVPALIVAGIVVLAAAA